LSEDRPELSDAVLVGVGSGGPGFNTYRPGELAFLIQLTRDLKARKEPERRLSISVSMWDWRSSRNQRVAGRESRDIFGFNRD
jgi:hypothetical protein